MVHYSSHSMPSSSSSCEVSYLGISLVFLTPALGGFIYGYDIGATSFVLEMLTAPPAAMADESMSTSLSGSYSNSRDDSVGSSSSYWWHQGFSTNTAQQGLFIACCSLGALLGSHLVLFHFSHVLSRRAEIRTCASLYLLGTVLNVCSGTILANAYYPTVGWICLLLGRFIFGMGVGFIMHAAPAYMAEMVPAQVRGALVSAKETVIVTGIVIGYTAGDFVSSWNNPMMWTDLYAVSVVLAVPMLILTFIIPRSQRWLLLNGYRDEAKQSMSFVLQGDIEHDFIQMANQIQQSNTNASTGFSSSLTARLFSREIRPALVASMGLIFLQQLTGQPSVISYATVLFNAAGWNGNASVVSSLLLVIFSSATVLLVDKLGRKRLLLTCCMVMCTSVLALSVCFWGWQNGATGISSHSHTEHLRQVVILIAMFLYIGGYQIGFGPLTWLIVSEVFPLDIRGVAIAFGVELNYLLNFSVQFFFPQLQDHLGWGPTFSVFACELMLAAVFINKFVPETTGLTLEEIESRMKAEAKFGKDGDLLMHDSNANHHHHNNNNDNSSSSSSFFGGLKKKTHMALKELGIQNNEQSPLLCGKQTSSIMIVDV